jgi:peptidyl-dipeptidase Dcp
MRTSSSLIALGLALAAAPALGQAAVPMPAAAPSAATSANPLLGEWTPPFRQPPFQAIRPDDYLPAFEAAMAETRADIDAIANNPAPPTFANTIEALEWARLPLARVSGAFFTVTGADGTPEISAIEAKIQPRLSRFSSDTYLNPKLWARVRTLWDNRASLNLAPEQARLLEITHRQFVRGGAALAPAQQARIAAIDERLTALGVDFQQKLVADQAVNEVLLTEAEMAGIPADARAAASEKAGAAGKAGYLVVPTRSEVEPFLTVGSNRGAREKVWRAFVMRGDNPNANNTGPIISEMLRLRLERAKLLGYNSYADFALENSMAKTPQAATDLMMQVYRPALAKAREEQADLMTLAGADGITRLEPWDWRYYAEKVRAQRYAFDEGQLKQYLAMPNMEAALWDTTRRLFGLTVAERPDIPGYTEGVRVFEVKEADGRHVGLFYADWFTRPTKRPGAWMNEIREQNGMLGLAPIVANNCNYVPAPKGQVALLSLDDADTMFHEFGHALHGLLSNTRYASLSGTNVYRDFVEFPSQVYEHWTTNPAILATHAKNPAGQPMPPELIAKVKAAATFNQGYLTVQQLSSALVDMEIHSLTEIPDTFDPMAFEAQALKRMDMLDAVGMRHRLAQFSHLFSGPDGYAAGYYSYTWSEVLEADAYEAWLEARGPWDTEVAARYRREILGVGNSRPPEQSYVAFRGRMPTPQALLKNRGLLPPAKDAPAAAP